MVMSPRTERRRSGVFLALACAAIFLLAAGPEPEPWRIRWCVAKDTLELRACRKLCQWGEVDLIFVLLQSGKWRLDFCTTLETEERQAWGTKTSARDRG